jgi:hypothetical protein
LAPQCRDVSSAPFEDEDEQEANEDGDDLAEVEEEAFNKVVSTNRAGASKRSANYTEKEDIALTNTWESISLDAVTGNDQSGKKCRKRIEDMFHRMRLKTSVGANRMLISLQGWYDTIKKCCSRWAACLEQVKNNPPSGSTIDDFVIHFSPICFLSLGNVTLYVFAMLNLYLFAMFLLGSYCTIKIQRYKNKREPVFHIASLLENLRE